MSDAKLTDGAEPARRSFLLSAAMLGAGALADPAEAAPSSLAATADSASRSDDGQLQDRLAIADLVQRERAARDAFQWDEMAASYHPQSLVDVSWYQGSGAGFVAASRRNAEHGRLNVHQLTPTVATVRGDRATAETPCQLVSFVPLDGVDMCMVGTVRLLWRAQRLERRWLIAGLRTIYVRDCLIPCNPAHVPAIDEADLARYRPSYRFLSYVLARSPNPPRDDLPGLDRPDTVAALRAGEARWLAEGVPAADRAPGRSGT